MHWVAYHLESSHPFQEDQTLLGPHPVMLEHLFVLSSRMSRVGEMMTSMQMEDCDFGVRSGKEGRGFAHVLLVFLSIASNPVSLVRGEVSQSTN